MFIAYPTMLSFLGGCFGHLLGLNFTHLLVYLHQVVTFFTSSVMYLVYKCIKCI